MKPKNYSLVLLERARPGAAGEELILVHGCLHGRGVRVKDYREWAESCRKAGFAGGIRGYYWDSIDPLRLVRFLAGVIAGSREAGDNPVPVPSRTGKRKLLRQAGGLAARAGPALLRGALNETGSWWEEADSLAAAAGVDLAGKIRRRRAGERLTLMGHSLGCRVIKSCLEELGPEARVSSVYLLGAAVPAGESWERAAEAVEGRIYNCFSRRDFILRFPYRAAGLPRLEGPLERWLLENLPGIFPSPRRRRSAAGRAGIASGGEKVVNLDLTETVRRHGDFERGLSGLPYFPPGSQPAGSP